MHCDGLLLQTGVSLQQYVAAHAAGTSSKSRCAGDLSPRITDGDAWQRPVHRFNPNIYGVLWLCYDIVTRCILHQEPAAAIHAHLMLHPVQTSNCHTSTGAHLTLSHQLLSSADHHQLLHLNHCLTLIVRHSYCCCCCCCWILCALLSVWTELLVAVLTPAVLFQFQG
jgi:hypothetical protein